jgi:hypothetical protein
MSRSREIPPAPIPPRSVKPPQCSPLKEVKEVASVNKSPAPPLRGNPQIAPPLPRPESQSQPIESRVNGAKQSEQSVSTNQWILGVFGAAFILVCLFYIMKSSAPGGWSYRTIADAQPKDESKAERSGPTEVSPSSSVAKSPAVPPQPVYQPPQPAFQPPKTAYQPPKPVYQPPQPSPLQRAMIDRIFINSLGMRFAPLTSAKGETVLLSLWPTRSAEYGVWKTTTGAKETDRAVTVSWHDAKAFCSWLTIKDHEAGLISGGMRYRLPTDTEWSQALKLSSQLGLSEMVGGVFQWCADLAGKNHRVLRGGNRANGDTHGDEPPSMRYGFRVVLEVKAK